MPRLRKPASPFRYFNSSPEVIRLVVMMYVRFPLSLRNVEDLLAERGIDICHETVRLWWNRFGPLFAADVRRQRVSRMHLYYTGEEGGNPYVSFPKDDRAIGKTIARFDDIVARIERQDYQMVARPTKLCVECDMRAYCDNKNWKFRKTGT